MATSIKEVTSVLSVMAFSAAMTLFMEMEPNAAVIYLVCHPSESSVAIEVVNHFTKGVGATANFAIVIRYADYLASKNWILTDGEKIVFSNLY